MSEVLFRMDGVGLAYANGAEVLSDVDLMIGRGERIVLLGANGCGKSTLLKALDALVLPVRGHLAFDGRVIDAACLRDRSWVRDFRRRVVLMFQQPENMLFNASVAEEIGFGLSHLGPDERQHRVVEWAGRLGLGDKLERAPFELSGGEQQRLCLACLLAIEPEVLLLDEPTANLDPRTVGWLIDWLAASRITTVIATHHLSLAREMGQRAIIVSEAHRIVFDGPVERALGDLDLLLTHNLAHRHVHRHGDIEHRHPHVHPDWS